MRRQRGYVDLNLTGCLIWTVILSAVVGALVLPTLLRWIGRALVWLGGVMQ